MSPFYERRTEFSFTWLRNLKFVAFRKVNVFIQNSDVSPILPFLASISRGGSTTFRRPLATPLIVVNCVVTLVIFVTFVTLVIDFTIDFMATIITLSTLLVFLHLLSLHLLP